MFEEQGNGSAQNDGWKMEQQAPQIPEVGRDMTWGSQAALSSMTAASAIGVPDGLIPTIGSAATNVGAYAGRVADNASSWFKGMY